MRGVLEADHFLHLEVDVAVDEVVIEHAAGLQELAILVEFASASRREPHTVGIRFSSAGGRS